MNERDRSNRPFDSEPKDMAIQRLCAAIELPYLPSNSRTRELYIGWDTTGIPMLAYDRKQLSQQALETLKEYRIINAPEGFRDNRSMGMEAVQYIGMMEPLDIKDIHRRMERDKLTIGITGEDPSNPEIITIDELTLLDAINDNLILWQEINKNTLYKGVVIPANLMFTMAVPHVRRNEKVLLFILFKPTLENQSNEITFQGFLMDALKSLIYLDTQQSTVAKKGYSSAFKEVQTDYSRELSGESSTETRNRKKYGSGFLIVALLNQMGYIKTPKSRMNDIRKASETGGLTKQVALVTLEIAMNLTASERSTREFRGIREFGGMQPLTASLLDAFSQARRNAHRSFSRFR